MKILVTGYEGMLGRTVMRRLGGDHVLVGVDLADGDLTDPVAVRDIFSRTEPQWVVHCAAWTDVDGAETSRDEAMAANAGATANLAGECDTSGAGLCFISTDYVFDGKGDGFAEEDRRNPINHYGLTKARAEEHVAAMTAPWQIVRTSWLFGDGRTNFVKTIKGLLAAQDTLRVVDDQRGSPTSAEDLADIIGFLVSGRFRGIFHGTNAGQTTWFGLAREIARVCGTDPERIKPCPSSEYPRAAARPECSILHSSHLEKIGCPDRPPWETAVAAYLRFLDSGQAVFP
ncbi:MAG: dTDP-4-dehydrorhamnose reductase [Candidatus Krumholzibacteriota bacterium]